MIYCAIGLTGRKEHSMRRWNVCFDLNNYFAIEVKAPNESAARDIAEKYIVNMSEDEIKDVLYDVFRFGGIRYATVNDADSY